MYSTRQNKVAYTVYHFSVFSSVFPRRSILLFTFAVLPFQVQIIERAVIAGKYLEVLKLGRCSVTILMGDTYVEPFREPPIRVSGPSVATCAPDGSSTV